MGCGALAAGLPLAAQQEVSLQGAHPRQAQAGPAGFKPLLGGIGTAGWDAAVGEAGVEAGSGDPEQAAAAAQLQSAAGGSRAGQVELQKAGVDAHSRPLQRVPGRQGHGVAAELEPVAAARVATQRQAAGELQVSAAEASRTGEHELRRSAWLGPAQPSIEVVHTAQTQGAEVQPSLAQLQHQGRGGAAVVETKVEAGRQWHRAQIKGDLSP